MTVRIGVYSCPRNVGGQSIEVYSSNAASSASIAKYSSSRRVPSASFSSSVFGVIIIILSHFVLVCDNSSVSIDGIFVNIVLGNYVTKGNDDNRGALW